MEKRLSNKMAMVEGVNAYLYEHENVYSDNAGLKEAKLKLQQKIDEINARENVRTNVLKGKREAKEHFRGKIITKALSIASMLFDYAADSGNKELKALSDYTRSGMGKIRDSELLVILNTIRTNTEANIEALSRYGITREKLDEFILEIEKYMLAIDRKKSSEAVKVSSKKTLSVLISEATLMLKRLDKMMEGYHESESQFYHGYKSARSIKDFGIRHKPEVPLSSASSAPPEPEPEVVSGA